MFSAILPIHCPNEEGTAMLFELVLPRTASSSAITATHTCVAVGVVVRRSQVPSASFLSSHARAASFPLQGMPSIDPFVPLGSSHHVPLPLPSPTRASTRQDVFRAWCVRVRIDCDARFVPGGGRDRFPGLSTRWNAFASAAASTTTWTRTRWTRARLRGWISRWKAELPTSPDPWIEKIDGPRRSRSGDTTWWVATQGL
mmetsp:Transcript_215/g.1603  ORF Transcript_215/g.1603 Transcript_215/m.1603 type:complete len:200 (+) Transcript_215:2167-2766(+)